MQKYQRLRDIREDNDLTQTQIAKVLGISQQYYAEYEGGKREMPMRHFSTLARYYDISLDYLAGLTDIPRTIDGKPLAVNKSITINQSGNGHFGQIHIKN